MYAKIGPRRGAGVRIFGAARISTTSHLPAKADFGRLPDGQRFGLVPAWALKLPGINPGPKALYASLCTNADEKGHLWRSTARVAAEFAVTRRQVQRWLNDLEAGGLLVRLWRGASPLYMVVRDPAGRDWAQIENLKAVAARRKGAKLTMTPVSHPGDMDVVESATPMSPKHNLLNTPCLTDGQGSARESEDGRKTQPPRVDGLCARAHHPHAASIQEQLNDLALEIGGWERLLAFSADERVELLAARCGADVPRSEIKAALGGGG